MTLFTLQTLVNFCRKSTMTIIQKLNYFFKNRIIQNHNIKKISYKDIGQKHLIVISVITFFSIIFISTQNFIEKKNTGNRQNLEAVTSSKEFSGFSKFLLSKIKSPYKNVTYSIKKNDTIEKILKKFDVREEDIKNISVKLKQKKLEDLLREEL